MGAVGVVVGEVVGEVGAQGGVVGVEAAGEAWSPAFVEDCLVQVFDVPVGLGAAGADAGGGKSVLFKTITVSDGISMGSPGMRYSLVSREVIADSIETVVGAEGFDGFVAIGGCDKNMPGCAMAMARLKNRNASYLLLRRMVRDGKLAKLSRARYALPRTDATDRTERLQRTEMTGENPNLSNLSED